MKSTILCLFLLFSGGLLLSQADSESHEYLTYLKQTISYKKVQDLQILADVYQPKDKQKHPVILWLHSGALIFGSRTDLKATQLEKYINAGYIVVAIDYRLAPETLLPDIISDLEDAYRWIMEKGPSLFKADAERIAVVGHSAGGYLSLMAGFRLDPTPKAVVSFYGYGDISTSWYTSPSPHYSQSEALVDRKSAIMEVGKDPISSPQRIRWPEGRAKFYLYTRQHGKWPQEVTGHDPKEHRWFLPYEPIRNVTSSYPPTLFLHGKNDEDVPFEKSKEMIGALRKNGVTSKLISKDDWDHMFDNRKENLYVVDKVIEFLDQYVKE